MQGKATKITVIRFRYPARLLPDSDGEIVVSFRDVPECLTSGADKDAALAEARAALEEAFAGRIADGEPIPAPSPRRAGERLVTVPPEMAAKAAFVLAFRDSGLSRLAFARRLGVNEKVVRRMLDPHHGTAANRIYKALRMLGRELIVETRSEG